MAKQKITPFLWFDTQAEEAAKFYVSVFKHAKLGRVLRNNANGASAPGAPDGSVLLAEFEIEGEQFTAMNGGPSVTFNQGVSFVVYCETQEEIDYYWNALSGSGGTENACGWLQDKYGLSWQITPRQLIELIHGPDLGRAQRAFQAMLQMKKIDLKSIVEAAET